MLTSQAIIVSRDTCLAGLCIFLFLFGFFQLVTGKYLGKAKSILPPELETKRISIATRHNQIVGALVLFVIGALFSIAFFLRSHPRIWTLLAIAAAGGTELYAIRRLFKYDEEICEKLGFTCPRCHKPLYEPRSFINLNGKCPKCGQS